MEQRGERVSRAASNVLDYMYLVESIPPEFQGGNFMRRNYVEDLAFS